GRRHWAAKSAGSRCRVRAKALHADVARAQGARNVGHRKPAAGRDGRKTPDRSRSFSQPRKEVMVRGDTTNLHPLEHTASCKRELLQEIFQDGFEIICPIVRKISNADRLTSHESKSSI